MILENYSSSQIIDSIITIIAIILVYLIIRRLRIKEKKQ
jgi:hypothetical protein